MRGRPSDGYENQLNSQSVNMDISEAVIQGLIKVSGSPDVTEAFRNTPSPINDRLNSLGEELLKIYSRLTNNYGAFDSDLETYRFPHHLEEYIDQRTNLVDMSKLVSRLIADRMGSSPSSTGGYAFFLRYQNQGRDWLLIVMLKLKTGTGIDQSSLELNESLAFDINHLHEAARIDIQKWKANEQPYLSFIKRSGRQDEVTRYFRLSLGCTNYTDSKATTDYALKAVDSYCESHDLTADQKREARRATYNYLEEKKQAGEPANLASLSARIDDQQPESFLDYVRDQEYPIGESFEPHKSTYSRFKRISESFRSIKLSFDVQDVIDDMVDYDLGTQSLIIRNPPETLIEKIYRAKGNDSTQ